MCDSSMWLGIFTVWEPEFERKRPEKEHSRRPVWKLYGLLLNTVSDLCILLVKTVVRTTKNPVAGRVNQTSLSHERSS